MSHPFPPTIWDAVIIFPTWVGYRVLRRWLPDDHMYKRIEKEMKVDRISLLCWTYGSKPLNYEVGFTLWFMSICVVFCLWVLLWGMRHE